MQCIIVYFYIYNMDIQEKLFELRDAKYAEFQAKLTPNVPAESFIGVRVPLARALAKEYIKNPEHKQFMNILPHKYYDENMLHGLLISEMKDFDNCIFETDKFLPYVDNWAVCDIMSPKIFKKHKNDIIEKIREWSASEKTYTCRFGIEMLMSHFLDTDFKSEYLEIPSAIKSEEYYVNMMIAWYFATALAKQWESTICYIEKQILSPWVHNKTIQKACESYRITEEQKLYLRSLKTCNLK